MSNHLELIVLQLCSIVLAPILRSSGVVFRAQLLIANFGVKMVSIVSFNCAVIIFDRTRLLSEIGHSLQYISLRSTTVVRLPSPPLIVNSSLEIVSINSILTVLNSAAIIFDHSRLLSQIWVSSYNMCAWWGQWPEFVSLEFGKGGEYDRKRLLHNWAQLKPNWLRLFWDWTS